VQPLQKSGRSMWELPANNEDAADPAMLELELTEPEFQSSSGALADASPVVLMMLFDLIWNVQLHRGCN
jgi:hypothetical protein